MIIAALFASIKGTNVRENKTASGPVSQNLAVEDAFVHQIELYGILIIKSMGKPKITPLQCDEG